MNNTQPTERQKEVLNTIAGFSAKNGYPPTLRELADILGVTSTNGVHDILVALEKKGLIVITKRISRGLQITEAGKEHLNA